MASISTDELDLKLLDNFNGLVVKKDLTHKLKDGVNVPTFVLEYLLANYCSTTDQEKLDKGMENVKEILKKHYVEPDQAGQVQSTMKANSRHKIIDRISVRLDPSQDKYWARLFNSNIKNANIPEHFVEEHDKLLSGGIWAIIDMEYDPEIKHGSTHYPFLVDNIQPIQLSSFSDDKIEAVIDQFSKEEWVNLLLRSLGLEPTANDMSKRVKYLLLSRLIPLVESNFNMIELGPRGTGKSYVYRELSPYAQLVSGGSTTVPQLFVNNASGKIGMVGLWDTVAFDEVAGVKFNAKDGIQLMKDYMESGSFSRGGSGELTGTASMVFNGNINQSVESLLKTSHLFEPLPESLHDTAFLDRMHFYLPGWEVMKYSSQHFTTHFGFSVDFFAEFLKARRRYTYVSEFEKYFSLGSHLQQRDSKAVKKTVSGMIKLFHPFGNFTKEDVREYLEFALEMRRRVKEQLKRIGGMEFWNTNFSYIDKDTQEEKYITIPEERSGNLIESTPVKAGVGYTVSDNNGQLTLVKIETITTDGKGKLNISGTSKTEIKQNIKNAYQYIRANEKQFLPSNKSLNNYDITIQLTPMIGAELGTSIGAAIFVTILTAVFKKSSKSGLGVLGDISIGGGVKRVAKLSDSLALLSDNGAKNVLVPISNAPDMGDLNPELLSKTNPLFYASAQKLLEKAIVEE
jgi:ATP-dependent Lon protease